MSSIPERSSKLEIKKIEKANRDQAISLVLAVFIQFEAPDYSSEGIETFKNTALYNEEFWNTLEVYGAFTEERLIGIIATRSHGSHIALFFVDGNYHKQGVGKKLFQVIVEKCTGNEITVKSSPYAVAVYRRLGFIEMEGGQNINGLRFIPMKFLKQKERDGTMLAHRE